MKNNQHEHQTPPSEPASSSDAPDLLNMSSSRGFSWGTALFVLLVVALVLGVGLATTALLRVPHDALVLNLPELPDLQDHPASLVEHLIAADTAARGERDADAIGALAMAYHADDFFRQAQQCYEVAQQLDPDNWHWKYYAALLYEDFGNTAAAIKLLEDVVEQNPKFASAWLRLGRGRFKLSQLEAAEQAFRQVIATDDPASPDSENAGGSTFLSIHAYFELARVAVKRNQLEEARKLLDEVTQRREDFGPGQRLLDRVLQELGRPREVTRPSSRTDTHIVYIPPPDPMVDELARQSHSSTFLMKQVDVAIRTRRLEWAEHLCRQAVRVNDSDPEAVGMLTAILLNSNRFDEASPYLERYLAIGGPEFVLLSIIGKAMLLAGRAELAVQVYQQVLQSNPQHATAHSLFSFILTTRGQHHEAIKHCKQALEVDPQLPFAHVNWGNALMALGQIDDAISHFESALKIQPNQASAHAGLGRALLKQRKSRQALGHLESALARAPGDVRLQIDLIDALISERQIEPAVRYLRTAVTSVGNDVAQLNRLAWLQATCPYEQIRDGATAISLAKRACAITDYKNPVCLDVLAVAYAEAGRFKEAIDTASRAASLAEQSRGPLAKRIRHHLELFRAGKPHREVPLPVAPIKTPSDGTPPKGR